MSKTFVPSVVFAHANDAILGRLHEMIGGWWKVKYETETVLLSPTCTEAEVRAMVNRPIIPQLVDGLRAVAKFYEETASFLEQHAAEIAGGALEQAERDVGQRG
jgi:hypothetical protein